MLGNAKTFSSFSVDDIEKARSFYGDVLGLKVTKEEEGLVLKTEGAGDIFIYLKQDHKAATFTVLNFEVADIEGTVKKLKERGVTFEHYTGELETDESGIFRGAGKGSGPNIAWFKDPAGNFLSVLSSHK